MSATHQYPKFTVEFGGVDKNSKYIDSTQDILQMCILPLTPLKKHPPRAWRLVILVSAESVHYLTHIFILSHLPYPLLFIL